MTTHGAPGAQAMICLWISASVVAKSLIRVVSRVDVSFFLPIPRLQDAPGVWIASNRRRAITRLASANSENNCAVFFASPR